MIRNRVSKIFRSLLRKIKLHSYYLRLAEPDDLDFVMGEIIDGARKGHYLRHLTEEHYQIDQKTMFLNQIHGRKSTRIGNRGIEPVAGRLLIYENRKNGRVGFISVTQTENEMHNSEMELFMGGIAEKHREQGHGTNMVRLLMKMSSPNLIFSARCFPASNAMCRILVEKFGFALTKTTSEGIRELRCKKL